MNQDGLSEASMAEASMAHDPSIDAILDQIALPEALTRIEDERPAFHVPIVDDRRLAYFLVVEGADPLRVVEEINLGVTEAGFRMEYCEKNDFYYRGSSVSLAVRLDGSPEGMSARFDPTGKPIEVTQTWHHIPAGRLVVTFAI
jgi:hypothetical protein